VRYLHVCTIERADYRPDSHHRTDRLAVNVTDVVSHICCTHGIAFSDPLSDPLSDAFRDAINCMRHASTRPNRPVHRHQQHRCRL
jgi:hypothetical protein